MTQREVMIHAPLSHPCYEGHFPGHPVVPGVLLIELIVEALGRGAPASLPQVKFVRPIAPGDNCIVRLAGDGARVSFRCERGSQPVAEGVLVFGSAA